MWGVQYPRNTEYIYYFLSVILVMQVIFRIEDNFCFISDYRNSFNCKLKKQRIIFYSPSNVICSSDESVPIKHFKEHTFFGMCSLSTWFNLQTLNCY